MRMLVNKLTHGRFYLHTFANLHRKKLNGQIFSHCKNRKKCISLTACLNLSLLIASKWYGKLKKMVEISSIEYSIF